MIMRAASIIRLVAVMSAVGAALAASPVKASTTTFFDATQSTNLVEMGTVSDTIHTEGYLFTLTRDKLFTGGVGLTNPIGRYQRVHWPDGLEAQAVTTGPELSDAKIVVKRADGERFAIESLSFKILANTAGAGAALEIMPQLNGEDGFRDPLMLDATGYGGMTFSYNTPTLREFDTYKITLYVDFALMDMTVIGPVAPPALEIRALGEGWVEVSWPANALEYNLEWTDVLPSQQWTVDTSYPVTTGDRVCVQYQATTSLRFFRLRK